MLGKQSSLCKGRFIVMSVVAFSTHWPQSVPYWPSDRPQWFCLIKLKLTQLKSPQNHPIVFTIFPSEHKILKEIFLQNLFFESFSSFWARRFSKLSFAPPTPHRLIQTSILIHLLHYTVQSLFSLNKPVCLSRSRPSSGKNIHGLKPSTFLASVHFVPHPAYILNIL